MEEGRDLKDLLERSENEEGGPRGGGAAVSVSIHADKFDPLQQAWVSLSEPKSLLTAGLWPNRGIAVGKRRLPRPSPSAASSAASLSSPSSVFFLVDFSASSDDLALARCYSY